MQCVDCSISSSQARKRQAEEEAQSTESFEEAFMERVEKLKSEMFTGGNGAAAAEVVPMTLLL